jgi:hypothetical protein
LVVSHPDLPARLARIWVAMITSISHRVDVERVIRVAGRL